MQRSYTPCTHGTGGLCSSMLRHTTRSYRLLDRLEQPVRCHTSDHSTTREACKDTEAIVGDRSGAHEATKLESLLALLRQAVLPEDYNENTNMQVVYSGHGRHLGIPMTWQLRCRPDGAFTETIKSTQLNYQFGYDGGRASKCWEVDYNGIIKEADLDDQETMLVGMWVRTGFWVTHRASDSLRVELQLSPQISSLCARGQERESNSAPVQGLQQHLEREVKMQYAPPGPASTSQLAGTADPDKLTLTVQHAEGEIQATLTVSTLTWRPVELQQPIGSLIETHHYQQWEPHENTPWFASPYRHTSASGSESEFVLSAVRAEAAVPTSALFSVPPHTLMPPGTRFDTARGGNVEAWWTPSGHLVVNPVINGSSGGYMILDTGASGLVIEKEAADRLGLESFGELHAAGMVGNVQSCFRRGETLQLGPLTVEKPLMMQISVGGIVRGAPGPVIGIIGCDVFIRCVIELPDKGAGRHTSLVMHDLAAYQSPADVEPLWQPVQFVSSLPIVTAEMAAGDQTHRVMLMLDSGAGGVDLMLHERATRELKLLEKVKVGTRNVTGVGGGGTEKQTAQSATLPWVQIGRRRFENARAICIGPRGLDLSCYTHGIICADLMSRCRVLLDLARGRIAFLPPQQPVNDQRVDAITTVSVAKPS